MPSETPKHPNAQCVATDSLPEGPLAEARARSINVPQAAQAGPGNAEADQRAARWRLENAEAIAYYNAWVEQNGMLLDAFRMY